MHKDVIYGEEWSRVREHLPVEIEEWAFKTGALIRRREIRSGEMLVRLLLAYACGNNSFEKTVVMAARRGWAKMSATALFYRLRDSEAFLKEILACLLKGALPSAPAGKHRLLLLDATYLSAPGAKASDFTLHVQYNPSSGLPAVLEIMDGHGGETLKRHCFASGDLVVGDRAYGRAPGIDSALAQNADVLVRIDSSNIRLLDANAHRIELKQLEQKLESGAFEFDAFMPVPPANSRPGRWTTSRAIRTHKVRIIGKRIHDDEALWLLTNLSEEEFSLDEALGTYRLRWQIELFFKRMKSILNLDGLTSRDPTTAHPWILLKMIAAALALKLTSDSFFPCQVPGDQAMEKSLEANQGRPASTANDSGRTYLDCCYKNTETKTKKAAETV